VRDREGKKRKRKGKEKGKKEKKRGGLHVAPFFFFFSCLALIMLWIKYPP
jgi:hypothetical protein